MEVETQIMELKTKPVFVYGSLMSGQGNNVNLIQAKLLGKAYLDKTFQLLANDPAGRSPSPFPFLYPVGEDDAEVTDPVVGEVYLVTERELEDLDRLEGVPHMYQRQAVNATIVGVDNELYDLACYAYVATKNLISRPGLVRCPKNSWRHYEQALILEEIKRMQRRADNAVKGL